MPSYHWYVYGVGPPVAERVKVADCPVWVEALVVEGEAVNV